MPPIFQYQINGVPINKVEDPKHRQIFGRQKEVLTGKIGEMRCEIHKKESLVVLNIQNGEPGYFFKCCCPEFKDKLRRQT
jgi:hypothetical protein